MAQDRKDHQVSTDNPGWAAWRIHMDAALAAYVTALLDDSSCNGNATHDGCRGEDCDSSLTSAGYRADDITPGTAREIEEDLQAFVTSCLGERPDCFAGITADMVGYDFYMTRNGHGVGFWDRDLGKLGDWLTKMAKPFGEASLHVGDDGSLYYWNR